MTNAALLIKGDHSKSDRNDASDSGTHDPMEKKKKNQFLNVGFPRSPQ